ncbi:DUF4180 domain-containing protein ['Paenibacillus yunnanensis' Narsing Rao et al. 2020]|uniref:DUF4180 domain-containing protein n=1 Tax=Paenibacillus tengchongensis TaxID=2608684 RepID=UPI00124CAD1B|nr:DUF4180 domain-containing protein [Paenibacillus tengchongensis]
MEITIDQQGSSKVAVVDSAGIVLHDVQDALDLMATVRHVYDCDKMLVRQTSLTEDFFELRTRLAGEILQKYTNYHFKLAIVGDFSRYNSKSLDDFIYECNQGKLVFFAASREEALSALHQAPE